MRILDAGWVVGLRLGSELGSEEGGSVKHETCDSRLVTSYVVCCEVEVKE